jgi:cytoskeletal protein CcmA (bactofilin family)
VVKARISAASIVIYGTTTGEITAKHRLEVRPTAKVSGNITVSILVVHEGATFDGNCAMGTGATVERREGASKEPLVKEVEDRLRVG